MSERTGYKIGEGQDRRTYRRPTLVDYGSVAKLTQGSGTANGDGGQNMMT